MIYPSAAASDSSPDILPSQSQRILLLFIFLVSFCTLELTCLPPQALRRFARYEISTQDIFPTLSRDITLEKGFLKLEISTQGLSVKFWRLLRLLLEDNGRCGILNFRGFDWKRK
jgi:hypothetical protein